MSSKVGFPIRKSADQRLFAPPHGLSQRTTSFIASQRQGIHRMPLRHLIVLMIDARPLGRGDGARQKRVPSSVGRASVKRDKRLVGIVRKTSCFEHVRSSCGQARRLCKHATHRWRPGMFPLHNVKKSTRTGHKDRPQDRFGMSRTAPRGLPHGQPRFKVMVEPDGIEPTTSCLQSTRSPS